MASGKTTMSERSVWVVCSGEYSDRYVDRVFSDEETARIYAGPQGDIEEFPLDEPPIRDQFYWYAYVDHHNNVKVVNWVEVHDQKPPTEVYQAQEYYRRGKWIGKAYGRSPELARKALSDALAKARAEALEPEPTYEENLAEMIRLDAERRADQ